MNLDLAKHVLAPGEGEVIEMRGPTAGSITILVDPVNTGHSNLCVLIQALNAGAAVPVHRHELAEQVLHFLSGRGMVSVAGHEVEVKPGTTVHVPKGVEHGIANGGDVQLSFLEVTTPPGFEEAFRSMSRLSEPTPEAIAAIGRKDVTALAEFLGDKPFLMGNTPTQVDAVAYGLLANIATVPIESPVQDEIESRSNLNRYIERVRGKYYA